MKSPNAKLTVFLIKKKKTKKKNTQSVFHCHLLYCKIKTQFYVVGKSNVVEKIGEGFRQYLDPKDKRKYKFFKIISLVYF